MLIKEIIKKMFQNLPMLAFFELLLGSVPLGPSIVNLDTLKGKPIPRLGYRLLLGFKHCPEG